MADNTVAELVKKAKGNDRTIREYANAAGIAETTLSKIISGKYVPQKAKTYKNLTCVEAAPRGGVTYQQLIAAANSTKSFQAGLLAGAVATEMALATIGALPIAALGSAGVLAVKHGKNAKNKKEESEAVERAKNEINRFVVAAKGLLYGSLGLKGIPFKVMEGNHFEMSENIFDTYLKIENQIISEYIFKYVYISPEQQKDKFIIENTPKRAIEELMFICPNRKRKVSIVTNCSSTYDYIYSFKDKMSYNGNLSIILVDEKSISLAKESYISHYSESDTHDEFFIV